MGQYKTIVKVFSYKKNGKNASFNIIVGKTLLVRTSVQSIAFLEHQFDLESFPSSQNSIPGIQQFKDPNIHPNFAKHSIETTSIFKF